MTRPIKPMTTKEFAKATGIPAATISKLIRDGKINAKKEGKVWMIPPSQLESRTIRAVREAPKAAKSRRPSKATAGIKAAGAHGHEIAEPLLGEQVSASGVPASPMAPEEDAPGSTSEPPVPEKSFSIPEFAAMTYLTDSGVSEWLRIGRLRGRQTEAGEWRVLESNLHEPEISRLVRK